jgi:hypothetical protein
LCFGLRLGPTNTPVQKVNLCFFGIVPIFVAIHQKRPAYTPLIII